MILTEKLCVAREYEEVHSKEIPVEQRPVFHISTPIGWMNDPNGFSKFQGKYHLFYQYHPYGTFWGPMHWGHFETTDFIKWNQQPCIMAPDMDYDKDGCFSGTAIEADDKHIIMYTGVKEGEDNAGKHYTRQTQCIAIGDGNNYSKYEKNPVITADMLPEGSSKVDFRDPKIWKDESGFWSLVGSKDSEGSGQLALFHSDDALDWKYIKMIDFNHNQYGEMWECPDFFELDDEQVLIVSPQFMQADGDEFHSGNNTIYFIGEYDKENHEWSRDKAHILDYGLDFYAAQTMKAEDGRRIMIAWLQSWDNRLTPDDYKWSGMMTIPRELRVKNGRLQQYPVKEITKYYKNEVSYDDYELSGEQGNVEIPEIQGRVVDLNVRIKKGDYTKFKIAVAADSKHRTVFTYDSTQEICSVDRSLSGIKKDYITTRSMKVRKINDEITFRILIDKYSIELFVNEGEQAMTTLIYTPLDAQQILWSVDGKALVDIQKNDIVVD